MTYHIESATTPSSREQIRADALNEGVEPAIASPVSDLDAPYRVIEAIESLVGDDQCEIWDMESRRLRGRSRLMYAKLAAIYRIAHSGLPTHSCYHVHRDWRTETEALLRGGA